MTEVRNPFPLRKYPRLFAHIVMFGKPFLEPFGVIALYITTLRGAGVGER